MTYEYAAIAVIAVIALGLFFWMTVGREFFAAQIRSKKDRDEKRSRFLKQAEALAVEGKWAKKRVPGFGRR